eukprot:3941416-Rhodomonas_salina.6
MALPSMCGTELAYAATRPDERLGRTALNRLRSHLPYPPTAWWSRRISQRPYPPTVHGVIKQLVNSLLVLPCGAMHAMRGTEMRAYGA